MSGRKSSLELRDQLSQGFRLLMGGEVTAGQPLDLEAELTQPCLGRVDLAMFGKSGDKESRHFNLRHMR